MKIFLIGIGGFIGSISRYLLSGMVQNLSHNISFPYGTFLVNVSGCFLIGFFAQLSESRGFFSDSGRAFVFVGILGGFTTFSAFSHETFNLLRNNEISLALLNLIGQVTVCLLAVVLGRAGAFLLWR